MVSIAVRAFLALALSVVSQAASPLPVRSYPAWNLAQYDFRLAGENGFTGCADVTPDGRFSAFLSVYDERVIENPPTIAYAQVWWRDLATGQTLLVSRDAAGNVANRANGCHATGKTFGTGVSPTLVSISADGSRVAFASAARNIDPSLPQETGQVHVYVWDRNQAAAPVRVDYDEMPVAVQRVDDLAISADGAAVLFGGSNIIGDTPGIPPGSATAAGIFVAMEAAACAPCCWCRGRWSRTLVNNAEVLAGFLGGFPSDWASAAGQHIDTSSSTSGYVAVFGTGYSSERPVIARFNREFSTGVAYQIVPGPNPTTALDLASDPRWLVIREHAGGGSQIRFLDILPGQSIASETIFVDPLGFSITEPVAVSRSGRFVGFNGPWTDIYTGAENQALLLDRQMPIGSVERIRPVDKKSGWNTSFVQTRVAECECYPIYFGDAGFQTSQLVVRFGANGGGARTPLDVRPGVSRCDANCDGVISPTDIAFFINAITNPQQYQADVAGFGCNLLINNDANCSGHVSVGDIALFNACITAQTAMPASCRN